MKRCASKLVPFVGLMLGLALITGGCKLECRSDDGNIVDEVGDEVEDVVEEVKE